jgi:hypothetical protein
MKKGKRFGKPEKFFKKKLNGRCNIIRTIITILRKH